MTFYSLLKKNNIIQRKWVIVSTKRMSNITKLYIIFHNLQNEIYNLVLSVCPRDLKTPQRQSKIKLRIFKLSQGKVKIAILYIKTFCIIKSLFGI